jgi:carboxynorspermidine decarboxylase
LPSGSGFPRIRKSGKPIACGLRVNPEHSESPAALYDPCAPGSRLGITSGLILKADPWKASSGLHFHTLCEQNADALERTLDAFEKRFGKLMRICPG